MKKITIRKCIVCKREFFAYGRYNEIKTDQKYRGGRTVRTITSYTCSKPCSKIYNKISVHLRGLSRKNVRRV